MQPEGGCMCPVASEPGFRGISSVYIHLQSLSSLNLVIRNSEDGPYVLGGQ